MFDFIAICLNFNFNSCWPSSFRWIIQYTILIWTYKIDQLPIHALNDNYQHAIDWCKLNAPFENRFHDFPVTKTMCVRCSMMNCPWMWLYGRCWPRIVCYSIWSIRYGLGMLTSQPCCSVWDKNQMTKMTMLTMTLGRNENTRTVWSSPLDRCVFYCSPQFYKTSSRFASLHHRQLMMDLHKMRYSHHFLLQKSSNRHLSKWTNWTD